MCRVPTLDPGDWYPEDESPGDARCGLGVWLWCMPLPWLWTLEETPLEPLGMPEEVVLTMLDLRIFKTRQRERVSWKGIEYMPFHFYRSVS